MNTVCGDNCDYSLKVEQLRSSFIRIIFSRLYTTNKQIDFVFLQESKS